MNGADEKPHFGQYPKDYFSSAAHLLEWLPRPIVKKRRYL
jgi:hypothetical protein